ncbi:unnamed protein product [Somion occarium]|uniref:3'-5' exonuclease domain-containing protein n=1 Tax=Somion occarium TaxID=3059160 RepID=A0ABP1DNV8_9APHY
MALQILKETKGTMAARHRLPSPPSSPSRRATSSTTSGIAFRSKLLAALDAEMEALRLESATLMGLSRTKTATNEGKKLDTLVPKTSQRSIAQPSIPVHPFFLKDKPTSIAASTTSAPEMKPWSGEKTKTKTSSLQEIASLTAITTIDLTVMGDEVLDETPSPSVEKPLYNYKDFSPEPTIVYTCHEEEANDLVQSLQGPLGFDLEWRVIFRKNAAYRERRTALVQLCDTRMILLIHISLEFPQKVKEIIESPEIVKTGANIRNDGQKLFRDFGVLAENLAELGGLAQQADSNFKTIHKRSIVSLAKMVNMYADRTMDKGPVRIGNWEAAPLSDTQKHYAANDAHSGLMVYKRLIDLAERNKVILIPSKYTSNLRQDYASGKLTAAMTKTCISQSISLSQATFTAPTPYTTPTSSQVSTLATQITQWRSKTEVQPGDPPRLQHVRAYNLWYKENMSLQVICAKLRSPDNPLAESTVISYVVRAIQANPSLPFDMVRLKAFVQLEAGSWTRHREWLLEMDSLLADG